MLVATPGQTASYSTLHNNSTNGGGSNNTAAATSTTKKPPTLNSTNLTTSGTAKSLNTNNGHAESTVTTKKSLSSNTHCTTLNYHANSKNDSIVSNKLTNQTKAITSSRENISSTKAVATAHSLKSENSTNTINTTTTKQQSFIQTLKDSVQKALISTTGGSSNSNNNTIVNKYTADNKLKANCNNSTTSINNVTSSSSSTTNNAANKVSTTTSSNTSNNNLTTVASQSSSSTSVVRGKHFSYSLSKLHTVAPTVIHRYPEERQHASSTDSLQKEMCHFKPIRVVPKTPWKSGSKSRGNSLRFPKANLATKKIEFVLKSNCDVNNRKRKQQQNSTQNNKTKMDEAGGDDNEQENKEFKGIYKPKPSVTCLSTSITTPNHQSAFVCLVAQMKNLVSMPSKRQLGSSSSLLGETSDESIKELYVKKRQKYSKKQAKEEEPAEELKNVRSTRFSLNISKNKRVPNNTSDNQATTAKKEISKRTNGKANISKSSAVAITKAKSRRKLGPAKSKINNILTLSATKAKEKLNNSASMPNVVASNQSETVATPSKNSRKRQPAQTTGDLHQQTLLTTSISSASTFFKSPTPKSRKSSRLSSKNPSADTSTELFKHPLNRNSQQVAKTQRNLATLRSFSPPMTRSRLKHLTEQGKIVATAATADVKKRKI